MALDRHTIVHALSSGKFSYELDDDDDAMTGNVTSNGLSDLEDPAEEQNNPLLIDVVSLVAPFTIFNQKPISYYQLKVILTCFCNSF
jgi:hypothetical protein